MDQNEKDKIRKELESREDLKGKQYFIDGYAYEENQELRKKEKDDLGRPLPKLSFNLKSVHDIISGIHDPRKRLLQLIDFEKELSIFFDDINTRYSDWLEDGNNPFEVCNNDISIKSYKRGLRNIRKMIKEEKTLLSSIEEKKRNYKPGDLLTRQEVAENESVDVNTVSAFRSPVLIAKYEKMGYGQYKLKGISDVPKNNKSVQSKENDSQDNQYSTIEMGEDYSEDDITNIISDLNNKEYICNGPLISTGDIPVKKYVKEHFHSHGCKARQTSKILWTGEKIDLLFFLLICKREKILSLPLSDKDNIIPKWVYTHFEMYLDSNNPIETTEINFDSIGPQLYEAKKYIKAHYKELDKDLKDSDNDETRTQIFDIMSHYFEQKQK